jgi:TonB family protein
MEPFTSGTQSRGDRAFRMAVVISVTAHLALAGFFIVKSFIKPKPRLMKAVYLFDMVEPPPQVRYQAPQAPRPAEPVKERKTEPVKAKAKSKAKALAVKKEKDKEVPRETASQVPEKEAEAPREQAAEAGVTDDNPLLIAKPGFPFSFYGNQIFAGIMRNWSQTPKELLEEEEQQVVVVRFDLMKDGRVVNVSIAESSWNKILDNQALRAVETAKIPPIPGEDQTLTVLCRLVLKR